MVLVVGCSGGERPEWLPPPANAVAQCRYDIAPAEPYLATRTVHFDAQGRPVQYDTVQTFPTAVRESWVYEYDERGRLLRELQGELEQRWEYSGNDVVHTRPGIVIHYTLDDEGRVITSQQVNVGRAPTHYEYDAAGRLARRFGATGLDGAPGERRFVYDARDRLTAAVDTDAQGERTTTVTYVDGSKQTSFEVRDPAGVVKNGFTVSFDDEGRIEGWASDDGTASASYVYTGASIERHTGPTTTTMTGACAEPTLLLAPPPRRITASIFLFETLYFFDGLG